MVGRRGIKLPAGWHIFAESGEIHNVHSGGKFQWRPFLPIDRAASLRQTLDEI
jgi:hypothetical protein